MTNVVKGNLKILNEGVCKIKSKQNKEKTRALIKLYENWKIPNSKTVLNQLIDFGT